MATANDPASIGTQGDDMLTTAERTDAGSADPARSVESPMPKLTRAEAALRDSEERYRLIAEQVTDWAIFTTDSEHRVATWPPGAAAVYGWTEAEMLGQPAELTFTPEDRATGVPETEFARARSTGQAPDVRWHRRKDGSTVFIEGVTRARYGAEGAYIGLLKIGQDKTTRQLAEEHRREVEDEARIDLERLVADATVELRTLSQQLLTVQEEERRFLARELHDEIGQVLTGLGMTLSAVTDQDDMHLQEAQRIVVDLTEQVRQLSMDLRPAALDEFGLLPALQGLVGRFEHRTGIAVDLRYDGLDRRFPAAVEIASYRIVQESLTNIARYAETDQAMVQAYADADLLTISIRDRGVGFDARQRRPGSGLGGMRERAELLDGTLTLDAAPGEEVVITVDLPLRDAERAP